MATTQRVKQLYAVLLALALGACGHSEAGHGSHEHDPGDDAGQHTEHPPPRDLATQPCDAGNWRELNPDLRECRLAGLNLDGTSMRRSNLINADLTGASLVGADLFKALLSHASLAAANMAGANLTSVDLTGANLTGANLSGAQLTNAVLIDALLEGATTDMSTACPNGTPGPCW
jgi:hypothetical protein